VLVPSKKVIGTLMSFCASVSRAVSSQPMVPPRDPESRRCQYGEGGHHHEQHAAVGGAVRCIHPSRSRHRLQVRLNVRRRELNYDEHQALTANANPLTRTV